MVLERFLDITLSRLTGSWKKLRNDELHDFCSSTYIICFIK